MAEKYVPLSKVRRKINYVLSVYSSGLVYHKISEALKKVPVEDVAPVRHGFWGKETLPFKDKQGNQHFGACCSSCGAILDRTKYCGECGAKMDEEEQ